jgi:hypothetical protein
MARPSRPTVPRLILPLLLAALALSALPAASAARTAYSLGAPARLQYDQAGGFCGEVSLQQLMLRHGAWIPQEVARRQGGGELLLGVNYDAAMGRLRISFENFEGRGYRAFYAWAKAKVTRGVGVVLVAYVRGLNDPDYDHIMPVVGLETSTGPDGGYADGDTILVNTGYGTSYVRRAVGGPSPYGCAPDNKTSTIQQGGCVPLDTAYGAAILGPTYAGIGPKTALAVPAPRAEPGYGRPGVLFNGTLRTTGLTAGKAYRLYRVTDLGRVPAGPTAGAAAGLAARDLLWEFLASGEARSDAVSFLSSKIAYFVVVAAP